MADTNFQFTTGPTMVPDVGTISYNGCIFSPLFETRVTTKAVPDNARRTIKLLEHTITVDGYVTLPAGATTIGPAMLTLYKLLTQQGKQLHYKGRALDISAGPGIETSDVAWGPVPELMEFQPLGAGRSAKVSWRVTVRTTPPAYDDVKGSVGLLQLNYETSVTYDEEGFSHLNVKGTMEIPLTRVRGNDREVETTVDRVRFRLEERILKGIDLGRFTISNRRFDFSRDKRTLEFDIVADEKPYMDLPPDCTMAGGMYTVRQATTGPGLINWICTLRATYTVANGRRRKIAYWAFMALMFLRMQQSKVVIKKGGVPPKPNNLKAFLLGARAGGGEAPIGLLAAVGEGLSPAPILVDFSIDEGLHRDSRTTGFSATWRLICPFDQLIIGAGTWRKVGEAIEEGKNPRNEANNLWARSMRLDLRQGNIMGTRSWLPNKLDEKLDVIVDMGATGV